VWLIVAVIGSDDVSQLHGTLHDETVQGTSRQTSQETSGRCQGSVSRIHAKYTLQASFDIAYYHTVSMHLLAFLSVVLVT